MKARKVAEINGPLNSYNASFLSILLKMHYRNSFKKKIWLPIHTTRVDVYLKKRSFFGVFRPNFTLSSLAKLSSHPLDLVHWLWQVNRVEKIGTYLLSFSNLSIFYYSYGQKLMVALKNFHNPTKMLDRFGIRFKMFLIV